MKKGLLIQFPARIREKILEQTIESYELRDVILKLIDKNPKFIIERYLKDDDLLDLLEQNDLEIIKNKLSRVLTYEWFYNRYKIKVKENKDQLIKDVALAFANAILNEKRYEYDEQSKSVKEVGNYNIDDYEDLKDFLNDHEVLVSEDGLISEADLEVTNSYLDSVAVNYLHETLKQLLIDVYQTRKEEFISFFNLELTEELEDRDFEELEYEMFDYFDTQLPVLDFQNPVGMTPDLIQEVSGMNAKLLFKLGSDLMKSENK